MDSPLPTRDVYKTDEEDNITEYHINDRRIKGAEAHRPAERFPSDKRYQ